MTERQTGLRFDIYERVHLADHTVGIKELDEVELVPHIQVYTEGEQALLKGNLYLTGIYAGETGEKSRTLEHLIPVEITLPLNRIHDVNEVAVDIDNFDVDLLSPRSLNITGVLTLHGIEMLSAPEESWAEEGETVFVHQAERYGDISPAFAPAEISDGAGVAPAVPEYGTADNSVLEPAQKRAEEQPVKNQQLDEESVSEFFVDADEENELNGAFSETQEEIQAEPVADLQTAPAEESQEEKKDLKLAFGSKPTPESPYYLKSLLHTGNTRPSAASAAVEEPVQEAQRTDSVEWKKLFVKNESEETTFRRVKVCIVQKEETLDSIARRYGLNAREILLHNGITEQDLTEGKVLFIPK